MHPNTHALIAELEKILADPNKVGVTITAEALLTGIRKNRTLLNELREND